VTTKAVLRTATYRKFAQTLPRKETGRGTGKERVRRLEGADNYAHFATGGRERGDKGEKG